MTISATSGITSQAISRTISLRKPLDDARGEAIDLVVGQAALGPRDRREHLLRAARSRSSARAPRSPRGTGAVGRRGRGLPEAAPAGARLGDRDLAPCAPRIGAARVGVRLAVGGARSCAERRVVRGERNLLRRRLVGAHASASDRGAGGGVVGAERDRRRARARARGTQNGAGAGGGAPARGLGLGIRAASGAERRICLLGPRRPARPRAGIVAAPASLAVGELGWAFSKAAIGRLDVGLPVLLFEEIRAAGDPAAAPRIVR